MKFGKVDNLVIFGGTQRLVNLISVAKKYKITVFSAKRLLSLNLNKEKVDLKSYLTKNKIRFFDIKDIKLFNIEPYINNSTLGISIGAPWIFSIDFINKFRGRFINGHSANLPENRGGGGFSWQIMRGKVFGCHLFHLIDGGIDTGNIIFFSKFLFPDSCRIPLDYHKYLEETEIDFFKEFLKKLESNYDFREIEQDEASSTYFPRLSTEHHGFINWSWTAQDIERFISAFDSPYKGASTFINGKRVYLKGAKKDTRDGTFHPFMNGLVYRKTNTFLFVAVHDGTIMIKEVYDEDARDIFNVINVGYRFVTPSRFLGNALQFRAVYDGNGLKQDAEKKDNF